jgi:phosphoenolpyruvate-protein phosphotransferase (PTS system enzyme I)
VRGLAVSPGIVIGRVLILEDNLRKVAKRVLPAEQAPAEAARFDAAVAASIADINEVYHKAEQEMGEETAKIFLTHISMLQDKALVVPIRKLIEQEHLTADYAVSHVFGQLIQRFRAIPDPSFSTKVNDIQDLGKRLQRHLLDGSGSQPLKIGGETMEDLPVGIIVVAEDLTPSQTAEFDRNKVVGFATDMGGRTSHTAIVAKALNIPAVVGCQYLMGQVADWMTIILDADSGVVVLNPSAEVIREYRARMEERRAYVEVLSSEAAAPSVTADGHLVQVQGNIEFPDETKAVVDHGGAGIGLYRTEFLYLTSRASPTEEGHFNSYKRCVELLREAPSAAGIARDLVIRTVDLGADKYTQAMEETPERNPMLGCRSMRYCLRDLPMFKRQLRAILRASALTGPDLQLKIMFPLITSLAEFRHGKMLLNDVMEDLSEEGVAFDPKIKVGMMVEVPSAAIMAEAFAQDVDFFSIGTNDLVQYTLAVDRTNERVANLYQPTHPAVIYLIRETARAAAKYNIPVSCCGETASDPEYAMLLIGLGVRTLSVSASSILPLKRFIRSVTISQCERVARQALQLDSDVQIAALLRDRARKTVPEAFDGRSGGAR